MRERRRARPWRMTASVADRGVQEEHQTVLSTYAPGEWDLSGRTELVHSICLPPVRATLGNRIFTCCTPFDYAFFDLACAAGCSRRHCHWSEMGRSTFGRTCSTWSTAPSPFPRHAPRTSQPATRRAQRCRSSASGAGRHWRSGELRVQEHFGCGRLVIDVEPEFDRRPGRDERQQLPWKPRRWLPTYRCPTLR